MKGFIWFLFPLLLPGSLLHSQPVPPVKRGVMVVRKKQNSLPVIRDSVATNNFFSNRNSTNEVKSMAKREPRYKGEPYIGKAEDVVVSVMDKNPKDFQYKYMDNALLLYGNFNTKPYALYEVKSTISQKLYMYFEQKWFELKQNTKKTPLEKIDNPTLVSYLNKQFIGK